MGTGSKANGERTNSWRNGDRYDGNWRDDAMDGYGLYRWTDGMSYSGGWKEGSMEGHGVVTWPHGARYEGEWANNHTDGRGTFVEVRPKPKTAPRVPVHCRTRHSAIWIPKALLAAQEQQQQQQQQQKNQKQKQTNAAERWRA
eukprot:gnl/Spiro4/5073_TR2533_c0_g1_i1.p2 gnl/Spiro4/5073_TR2533_c0_g1~~gnl/Spiro4/5073_TR2533_c0_g1_i1.p2  ORF type:complete len:143 (-),score=20.44 gnl/Spiro4/5073_TR2533_c0_g1_i1:65-493(-)